MQEEPIQKCDNCLKAFPESKMATHYGYCRRNIKKCPQCGELYDINFEEEHEEEFHKKAKCQHCKREIVAADLAKHQLGCDAKPRFCQYCEMDVPSTKYAVHLKECESRTKPCDKCDKPITNKDYLIHIVSCKGKEVSPQPQTNSYSAHIQEQRRKMAVNPQPAQIKPTTMNQQPTYPRQQIVQNQYKRKEQAPVYAQINQNKYPVNERQSKGYVEQTKYSGNVGRIQSNKVIEEPRREDIYRNKPMETKGTANQRPSYSSNQRQQPKFVQKITNLQQMQNQVRRKQEEQIKPTYNKPEYKQVKNQYRIPTKQQYNNKYKQQEPKRNYDIRNYEVKNQVQQSKNQVQQSKNQGIRQPQSQFTTFDRQPVSTNQYKYQPPSNSISNNPTRKPERPQQIRSPFQTKPIYDNRSPIKETKPSKPVPPPQNETPFDPTAYDFDEIQGLSAEDRAMQEAILMSMGAKKPSNSKPTSIPSKPTSFQPRSAPKQEQIPYIQGQDFMNQSFIDKQMAIQAQLQSKKKGRR